MPKISFKTIDDYIAAQPELSRAVLQRVRSIVGKALPRAEEVISYNIPAYKLQDEIILFFAAWKRHYSVYPAGERLQGAFREELGRYQVTRGTIRFPLSEPVPANLIAAIAKFRAKGAARHKQSALERSRKG